MLDDFRQQADQTSFEEEVEKPQEQQRSGLLSRFRLPGDDFLGLTAKQRFIVALMLLLLTVFGGAAGLLLTGRVVLPIF
jgi:hypothetical protein